MRTRRAAAQQRPRLRPKATPPALARTYAQRAAAAFFEALKGGREKGRRERSQSGGERETAATNDQNGGV